MIGLGSNRLTVCRRGGMSVTQAGRGGMEWLAGGRAPLWSSPYSAQATAALYAQFPTQWPTIRDYGFAHPEIVGYMNAYAPEDAKIAYSLVEGIGRRYIYGDGTAYIDTGALWNVDGDVYKMKVTNMKANFIRPATGIQGYDGSYYRGHRFLSYSSAINGKSGVLEAHYDNLYLDGVSIKGNNDSGNSYGGNVRILRAVTEFDWFQIESTSTERQRNMVPFVHDDNGTKKNGMIDLLTGTWYGNGASSGTLTISEEPAS